MNKFVCWMVTLAAAWHVAAQDKSALDIDGPTLGKSAQSQVSSHNGVMLRNSFTELTLISGAYFTLGTSNGLSASGLDDRCDLTFGHPYALTSYPVFSLDGIWQKPDEFFANAREVAPAKSGDTLKVVLEKSGSCRLTFALVQADAGREIEVLLHVKNLDAAAHAIGLGLVFDPALGRWGDGHVLLPQTVITRDTLLQTEQIPAHLEMRERRSAARGLGLEMNSTAPAPDRIIFANWSDIYKSADPAFTPSTLRTLYDLTMKMIWNEVSVAAGGDRRFSLKYALLPPEFGESAFMRWDLPSFLAIERNVLFPLTLPAAVEITNTGASSLTDVALALEAPAELTITKTPSSFSLAPNQAAIQKAELQAHELYEDRVVAINLQCKRAGHVIDELSRNVFIPAVPLSDTGLVVQIDTVETAAFPEVSLVFEAKISATQQLLTRLTRDNVFLFEDGARVREFDMVKDTSGGVQTADLVFVLDVTGSMGDEINDVKNNIMEFADSLSMRGVDFRLGLVTFLDEIENVYPFTTDVQAFQQLVGQQYAHGGGDYPENSLAALKRASEFPFRPAAKRVAIWITDAAYHERDAVTSLSKQEVIDALLAQDMTVHAVGNPVEQTASYDPITIATGGNFYDIYGNFRDVLIDIARFKVSGRYRLSYAAPASGNSSRQIGLEIHYAGLGGSATARYTPPGQAPPAKPLLACYPNPFNPTTTFRLNNPEKRRGEIFIYNLLGQRVRSFAIAAGENVGELRWDGRNDIGIPLGTGFYFVQMKIFDAQDKVQAQQVQKVVYMK